MALTTRRRALTTLGAAFAGAVALPATSALAGEQKHRPRPLWRAHAHNDYDHPRPLFDALDHRFGSVEVDIYLVGDQLLVAHDPVDLDPTRTIESLYLDPLAARVKANHGSVYRGYRTPCNSSSTSRPRAPRRTSNSTAICAGTRISSRRTSTAACTPARSPP